MNEAGYKYIKTGDDYEFYTAYGAAYAVSFQPAGEYFKNTAIKDFIYRMDVVQSASGPYNHLDFRINITIAEIIFDFLMLIIVMYYSTFAIRQMES